MSTAPGPVPGPVPVDDEEFNIQVTSHFQDFLENFELDLGGDEDGGDDAMAVAAGPGLKLYLVAIERMVADDRITLYVDFSHLVQHQPGLSEMVIEFHFAVDPLLRGVLRDMYVGMCADPVVAQQAQAKQFFVSFFNLPYVTSMRSIRSERVGSLLALSGTVTRTSDVRPELLIGGFRCSVCLNLQPPVEQQFRYTEPRVCSVPQCPSYEKGSGGFQLDFGASTFVDWQRLRVQENADEVPSGAMPRTLDVIVRAENVETVKAGDRYVFCGTLLAVPDVSQLRAPGEKVVRVAARDDDGGRRQKNEGPGVSGLRDLGVRELTYGLCFLASAVQDRRRRLITAGAGGSEPSAVDEREFSEEELAEVGRLTQDPNLYANLVRSVAPSVFGHDEIKRGILLMLFGGVHKSTPEGISLRGDINVCVVGDPSTSKSQFLKYVASFVPRAVYTSGKASSAAGLTAAVAKDPDTGEFNVEAGALMLADNGICCIDEFDKMNPGDQVAIHEAMEQQTISISKAGIQATLMARTSVLAAANPIGGRYDKAKTLKANLNISAPIMSRFDLFFIVLDECDERADLQIAEHIIRVHQLRDSALRPPYEAAELQLYLRYARTLMPVFTDEAEDLLVEKYRELRSEDMGAARTSYRITVRQLESMVRLAEALARLHCDEHVRVEYVEEAARLLQRSIIHIESEDILFPQAPNRGANPRPSAQQQQQDGSAMQVEGEDIAEVNDEGGDGDGGGDEEEGGGEPPQQIRMTFERYQQVAQMLAMYVHREMKKSSLENSEEAGVRQRDMVRWYIDQEAEKLGSMEALELETRTMRALIQRLIDVDHVLFVILDDEENEDDRILVIHPNFEIVNEDF